MKKLFAFILISTVLISSSLAEEIFSDDFTTSDYISSTTLKHVKENNGYLTIDSVYYPNAIAVSNKSTEYAVINDGKIEIYNMGETNARLVDTIDNGNIISSPIGITYADNGHSIWVLNEDSLVKYDLTGNSDPISRIHGLENVMSITSSKGYETVSILDSNGNITGYKELIEGGIEKVSALSRPAEKDEIENPLAISSVSSTDDIIMLNDNEVVYYEFDDNNYKFNNSSLPVTMGDEACSIAATEGGFVILNKSGVDYYSIDEEDVKIQSIYSVGDVPNGVGISLKKDAYDEYEYAIIDEDGNVKYYQYDGNEMKENEKLSREEIKIPRKLILDEEGKAYYISKEIDQTDQTYNQVTLSAEQYSNDGSITWYIDTGNGRFDEVANGGSKKIEGQKFRIKAEMQIENIYGKLPKIDRVALDVSKVNEVKIENVEVIGITKYQGDKELPTNDFPVEAKRGSQVVIRVITAEDVETVNMKLTVFNGKTLKDINMEKLKTGIFIGSVVFEPDELEGKTITAYFEPDSDSDFSVSYDNFINIESAVSYDLDLQIRQ